MIFSHSLCNIPDFIETQRKSVYNKLCKYVYSLWFFWWKCCLAPWTNKSFGSWQGLYITLKTLPLPGVCRVDAPNYRDRAKWQSSVTPLKIQSSFFPFFCLVTGTLLNWYSGAAGAASREYLHAAPLLKIQFLGNIKSEFTSIKQKLSISHSSIIKYWHQK